MSTKTKNTAANIEPKDLLAGILQTAKAIYSIDKEKAEKNGVPVTVIGIAKFYVRRASYRNNPTWREHVLKVLPGMQTDEDRRNAYKDAFVDYLLVSVETLNGEKLPFGDKEKAEWKKTFKELPELFEVLEQESERLSNFTHDKNKADEKN